MRVRRGLLFLGLFLIPLGAMTLAVRAGLLDVDQFADAWRLWPLLLIGIGVAILLARSRAAIVGTMIIAILLGTLSGAAIAAGPGWIVGLSGCSIGERPADAHLQRSGPLAANATVRLEIRCGSLAVNSTSTSDWRLDSAYAGPAPLVTASSDRLDVRVPAGQGVRREAWTIELPVTTVGTIDLTADAATATLGLGSMHLARFDATMNAGDLKIDGSAATIDELHLTMNAGRARIVVGSKALRGDLAVNAGGIDLCVPDGVGLRFAVTDQLTFGHNLAARGLARDGQVWTRTVDAGSPVVDLRLEGNASGFTLNPDGGCR
jgi:hypothetical protein